MQNAVRRGIEEHGDDFELAVQQAPEGRGAGADFDSTAEEVTEWYQRTDEEGQPVDYDYETGTYADGWTPDTESGAESSETDQAFPDDGRSGPADASPGHVPGDQAPRA